MGHQILVETSRKFVHTVKCVDLHAEFKAQIYEDCVSCRSIFFRDTVKLCIFCLQGTL